MPVLVPVRGDKVEAIGGAVDRDFALGATANGADFLALGRAISFTAALFANRADLFIGQLFFLHKKARRLPGRFLIRRGRESSPRGLDSRPPQFGEELLE